VPLFQLPYPLNFSTQDLCVRDLDELASQMRVSRAFIRVCVVAGCPHVQERLSAAELLRWLFDHFEEVRAVAGLRPLAELGDLAPQTLARLRMANALVTLLEFSRSRATHWRKKRQLREALEQVERLADSAA
jgi:hypothetical protein